MQAPAKKPAAKKVPLATKKTPNDSISEDEETDYVKTPAKSKAQDVQDVDMSGDENAAPKKASGSGKNASEMYQKVRSSALTVLHQS